MVKDTRFDKIYDLTRQEREVVEWRDQRRLELRNQYLREKLNPDSDSYVFDPQIQRHYSTTFATERIYKPTLKNFWGITLFLVLSIGPVMYMVKNERDEKEHRFRTGQVSYRDRDWKFV